MWCTVSVQTPLPTKLVYHCLVGSSKVEFVCRVLPLLSNHRLVSSKQAYICQGHVEWVYSSTLPCSRSWVRPLLFHLPVTSTSAFFCCNFETRREPWVCRGSNAIFTADISHEIDPVPPPQAPQPLSSPERDTMYTCLNFNP